MPDTPVPLREALAEAVAELREATFELERHWSGPGDIWPFVGRKSTAEIRVASLLSKIPIVLEAREVNDGE